MATRDLGTRREPHAPAPAGGDGAFLPRAPRLSVPRPELAVAALAVLGALLAAGLVVALDRPSLTPLLVVAPLAAALGTRPLLTAVIAVLAVGLAIAVGFIAEVPSATNHGLRVFVIAVTSTMAVWIASLRSRLEADSARLGYLAEVGAVLSGTLELRTAMAELARLAVPAVSDWCIVDLLRDDGTTDQVAVVHWDAARRALGEDMLERFGRGAEVPLNSVLEAGEPLLIAEVTAEVIDRVTSTPEHERMMRQIDPRSVIIVPLQAAGRTLGAVTLVQAESGRHFDEADLAFAVELARRAGIAAENARLFAELADVGGQLRASRDELRAILEGVADGITAQAPDGSLVYANEAAARASGFASAKEMLAAPPTRLLDEFEIFDEEGEPFDLARLPGRLALQGRTARDAVLRFRSRRTGEERWSVVKASPIQDERGEVVLAINVIENITARKAEEQRARFLSEVGRVFATSLNFETTVQRVADLCVPELADWCVVDVFDEHGSVNHGAVAHRERSMVHLLEELREHYPLDTRGVRATARVQRSGDAELFPRVTQEMKRSAAMDDAHFELLDRLAGVSGMIVPMVARGRSVGAITLTATSEGRAFGDEDLQFAEEVARRAALAVDNARLFSERTYIARALQESLLPPELPDVPGMDVAARFHAAGDGNEVGGDFYDLFQTAEDEWALLIGDVCGKGADAAAVTGLARYTLRAAAMREIQPSAILETLNEAMLRQRDDERFCTVALGRLDLAGGAHTLTVASGGHPLPLVLRADGSVQSVGHAGTLLGVLEEPNLADQTIELGAGDAVVLFTDGVTEAHAPDHIYGAAELAAILGRCTGASAAEIAAAIESAALTGGRTDPRDDIAVLVLKVEV